jgi:hypothetical protein
MSEDERRAATVGFLHQIEQARDLILTQIGAGGAVDNAAEAEIRRITGISAERFDRLVGGMHDDGLLAYIDGHYVAPRTREQLQKELALI